MKRFYLFLLALAAIITHGYAYKAIDLSIGAIVDEETVPVTVPQRDVDVAEDGSVIQTCQVAYSAEAAHMFTPIGETDDWFEVDGIQYHIIDGGTACEVGSYTGDGSCGMHTYSRMRHISIPATVTHNDITYTVVGVKYMGLMTDLITLTLPEGMKYLQGASQSNRLERLEIPEGMEHISSVAYFPRLRELTLPSNPVKIESSFDKCPSLERVTVNATEPYEMDESSFKGCKFAVSTLVVPEGSVEAYSNAPFWSQFGRITDDPSRIRKYGDVEIGHDPAEELEVVFAGSCAYALKPDARELDKNVTPLHTCVLVDYHDYNQDYWYFYEGAFMIPPAIEVNYEEYIVSGISGFYDCSVSSVEFNDYFLLKYINGFKNVKQMRKFEVFGGIYSIDGVHHCPDLEEVSLPKAMDDSPIDLTMAFYNCPKLAKVTVESSAPADYVLGKGTFSGCNVADCTLIVPDGAVDAYASAPGWSDFGLIIDNSQAGVGEKREAIGFAATPMTGGLRVISGDARVEVFDLNGLPVATVAAGQTAEITAAPGLYLLRSGKKVRKLVVR